MALLHLSHVGPTPIIFSRTVVERKQKKLISPDCFSSGAQFYASEYSSQQTVCMCVWMCVHTQAWCSAGRGLWAQTVVSQIISTYCIPGEARHTALHASVIHYRGDGDRDEGWCVNVGVCVQLNPYSQTVSINCDTYSNDTSEVTLSPLFNHIRD